MMQFSTTRARAWATSGLLLLGPLAGQAQTIFVGPTRTYPTLRAAVNAGVVVSGSTVQIDNGTYSDVCVISGRSNVTITSTSGRAGGVIFDNAGQGNLALGGKAVIVVSNSPGFAAVGLWFKNVGLGGAAGVAQQGLGAGNQAGLRFESLTAAGTGRVSYCAFDGCVTGVFAAPSAYLSLSMDHCDFGYQLANGQAQDGYSHDAYLGEINALTCNNNNWYGDPYANNCKTRAATTTVSGGYNANSNGRCIDMPAAGNYTVAGGIYVGAGAGQQPFAYGEENFNNGTFNGTIDGITLRIGVTNATIWNNAPSTTMAFSNTTLEWYGTGTIPLMLRGPGLITGLATSGPATAPTLPAAPGPVSGIGGTPLPVELIDFTAQPQNGAAALEWTTAQEKNSARFEVEVSEDGKAFWHMGAVAGQGTSTSRHTYHFLDGQLLSYGAAQVYYRLRLVDGDGTVSYSPVRTVAAGKAPGKGFAIYPTQLGPEKQLHYALSGALAAPVVGARLEVRTLTGQCLLVRRLAAGDTGAVALPALPAGGYLACLRLPDGRWLTARFGLQ